MEHRSALRGSSWCTVCCCTLAEAWAVVSHRAFGDLFPVSGTFQLGLTLHSGPSLRHLQFNTHGLILTHGLMSSKTKKVTTQGAVSPFPTTAHPSRATKKCRIAAVYFSSPDSQAVAAHRWLEMSDYSNWDSNSSSYQNYHFCGLSVTNSTLVFPLPFNPRNSRARSHKNSFQYLHHRNTPKP